MTIIIILVTALLVLDCLILSLLVIIQLPKKEAGVGVAFGGGTTDALFGSGSGTALSNLTKYTSIAFFILVFLLSVLNTHARHADVSALKRQLEKQNAIAPSAPAPTPAPAPSSQTAPAGNSSMPLMISTNNAAPASVPATNAASATK